MTGADDRSPLAVTVDLRSPVPPFEQIRAQITAHLSAGALGPGDRLPTVRALAADLGVAVGTVSRAYRELERDGAVTSRRRTGTVVSDGAPGTTDRGPTPTADDAPPMTGTPRGGARPATDTAAADNGVTGLVAAADALAAAAVAAGADDREILTLVSGALLLARRTRTPTPRT